MTGRLRTFPLEARPFQSVIVDRAPGHAPDARRLQVAHRPKLATRARRPRLAQSLPLDSARPQADAVTLSLAEDMNIVIQPRGIEVDDQVRAYVEYRMFSAVSRFGRQCVRLNVHLEESDATPVGTRYGCAVALQLSPPGRVRVRATADRLYAAVDESAERLSRGVQRRLGEASQDGGTRATGRRRR